MIFNDEEITDERIEERKREVLQQIDAVRKARAAYEKAEEKLERRPKKDKRKYRRRALEDAARPHRALAAASATIEFTEAVKRRLIEEIKEAVERVQRVQREIDGLDRQLNPKTKKPKLKEEDKKNASSGRRSSRSRSRA